MRIAGIDPGLKATGYGFIEYNYRKITLFETGTIEPNQREPIHYRIEKIYTILNSLIDEYTPDVLVLEKIYAHYKHPVTASILGHARGAICLLCAQKKIELVEYSVKRIRQALVGNGNATKGQTQRMVAKVLAVDSRKLTLDASDALALALGYIRISGSSI